jgi:hypothetical protein
MSSTEHTREGNMVRVEFPVENEAEVQRLENEMKRIGATDVDVFGGLFGKAEEHYAEVMRAFRHPMTGEPVSYVFRREARCLVLEIDIAEEHEDAVAAHLGA